MTTCKTCGKWAGAHATLPGQPSDHLCHGHPATAQPTASNAGERGALLCETRDKATSLLRHYGGYPKTASKLHELIDDCDREIDSLRAALASKPPADNWQQYAKEGETAQACIERHRSEQDGLMNLLKQARTRGEQGGAV